jgi:glucokinase-like ROK family protein
VNDTNFPRGSSHYISLLNKIKVLNIIREQGQVSRADIAKMSGISAPTVTRIVNSLTNVEGLVREIGSGTSTGGRRPTLIEFSGLDNFVIGVDLGTTKIYGVLCNLNAEIIADITVDTVIEDGFQAIMARVGDVICELCNHSAVGGKKIFGIGLAVAGLINKRKNIVELSPNFHWKDADIIDVLAQRCDLPIIFDNVTRVMALGELWYGIGKEIKDFVVINIGYGIGAGIIFGGEPYFGPEGLAGEFGHITLEKDSSFRCECGNSGCLEALASGRAIAAAARKGIKNGARSSLLEMSAGDPANITAEHVANAAKHGDELALRVFKNAAEYIGVGIAGLVNLLSPEAVLIGGGVSQAGDLLFDTINRTVDSHQLHASSRKVLIQPVTFGMKAAAMGSIALILDKVLHLGYQPQ